MEELPPFHPVRWLCFACFAVPALVMLSAVVLWGYKKIRKQVEDARNG